MRLLATYLYLCIITTQEILDTACPNKALTCGKKSLVMFISLNDQSSLHRFGRTVKKSHQKMSLDNYKGKRLVFVCSDIYVLLFIKKTYFKTSS